MSKFLDRFGAALIDMDGVLFDSMKGHTFAWHRLMSELGVECDRDEFYLYEGMTGKATVNLLFRRAFGREAGEEEVERLYTRKAAYFRELPEPEMMPGASRMLAALERGGLKRILVTGSAQGSLLDRLDTDYPGVFPTDCRITAKNVKKGKPDPEPYLLGAELAGLQPERAMVVENAPLGVRAGKAAGAFTVAVTTGPVPREEFEREGADAIFPSMEAFADWLEMMEHEPLQEVRYMEEPADLLKEALEGSGYDRAVIVTDPVVAGAMPLILKDDIRKRTLEIMEVTPPGEGCKSPENLVGLWRRFSDAGMTRRSMVINIGGGTVTDLGGFAAATYKRGICFVNIPTTVLGAADAAVGGKTGIDLGNYKNEVGAFAPAAKVIVCGALFHTLPLKEILDGMAEIVKTAMISSGSFYEEVRRYFRQSLSDGRPEERYSLSGKLAARAAEFKSIVVAVDPREKSRRKILNFGHTAGHAFESASGGKITHGTAVVWGIYVALLISAETAGLPATLAEQYCTEILCHYPRLALTEEDTDNIIRIMDHDKKNPAEGEIRMVLLAGIGRPLTDVPVSATLLRRILPGILSR